MANKPEQTDLNQEPLAVPQKETTQQKSDAAAKPEQGEAKESTSEQDDLQAQLADLKKQLAAKDKELAIAQSNVAPASDKAKKGKSRPAAGKDVKVRLYAINPKGQEIDGTSSEQTYTSEEWDDLTGPHQGNSGPSKLAVMNYQFEYM